MDLNELRDRAYSIAKEHGWHDEEQSDNTYLMLIITEIAEAVNADRKGKHADIPKFKEWQGSNIPLTEETRLRRFKEDFEEFIKDTVEDELADTVIRCLDFAGLHGYDLQNTLDNIPDSNSLDEVFRRRTFADIALGICAWLINTSNLECAERYVLEDVFAYCRYKGIDIEWHIERKMRYNGLRGYKHGNKKY